MSRSCIFVLDKDFKGNVNSGYKNSWWFSPVVWDVLLDKYLHDDIQTPYGYKKSLIGPGAEGLDRKLNSIVNNCDNFPDRVCWEMTNQQVFFTKDKREIAQAIKDFCKNNTKYHINEEQGVSTLTFEHIVERFEQIANDILNINEEEHPYFVFKNTSVDDNVEFWFYSYDEDDDYYERTLKEVDKIVTEFVEIENGQIKGFVDNLTFFSKQISD